MSHRILSSFLHAHTSKVNPQMNPSFKHNAWWGWKRLSLRVKASLLVLALSAVPVLGVGTITLVLEGQLAEKQIIEDETNTALDIQNQLYLMMRERFGDTQLLAEVEIFTDPDLRQRTTAQRKAEVLERFMKAHPIYDSIAVFDQNGDLIAQTSGKPLGNHKDRLYIQDALRTQGPVVSQPMISTSSGILSVYTAAPIKHKVTGEVMGTIRTRVPVENLVALLKDQQGKKGIFFYLLNGSGEIFYGPEGAYNSQVNTSGVKLANSESVERTKSIAEIFPALEEPLKAAQKETPGELSTSKSSKSLIAVNQVTKTQQMVTYVSSNPLKGLPDLNWSVVLAADQSVVFAAQRQQSLVLVAGIGLTLIAVSAIAVYLINRLLRPILESAKAVEKIGRGELDTRVSVEGEDELATLGININRMADQLQGLLNTLQQNTLQFKRQYDVLADLGQDEALIQGNALAAANNFTEAIAQTLNVERVGIWLYNANRSYLTCFNQYDRSLQQHSDGEILWVDDLPNYFQALSTEPLMVLDDVQSHPAVRELLNAQLLAPDTCSLLNIPIQITNRTIGIIRCDRVKTNRSWRADEQVFVSLVANLVAIVLESDFLQREVNHLLDVVSEVEEGNLTTQAEVSDRTTGLVADTFNRLIERLALVMNQVLTVARQVSKDANQQKLLAETVATNAEQQAQASSLVLHLTEQVEDAAQGSAEKVKVSNHSLQTASATVALGQEAMSALVEGIHVLQQGTDRIMQRMKTLGEFMGLADQFVQDQSQIALITQSLSLNASLIAARASEQRDPKQFAVVAREFDSIANQVSKLAQQTSDGLTNLEQRNAQIHSVVSEIDSDVQGLGKLVRQFTQGVEQSNQAFSDVQKVTGEAVQVGEAVSLFSQKILETAQATAHVMQNIAELANKTAELTRISRGRSEQIDLLSARLLENVQFFRLPSAMENDSAAPTQSDRKSISQST